MRNQGRNSYRQREDRRGPSSNYAQSRQGSNYRERDDEGRFTSRYGGENERYSDEYEDEGEYEHRGGGRGFAGMDEERHREISSRGGRNSHGGRGQNGYDSEESYEYDEDYGDSRSDYQGGGRGFASMDRERVSEIASRGGRNSHGGQRGYNDDGRYEEDEYEYRGSNQRRSGGRGFASMDQERVREIASMGGRAAHRSGHAHEWNSREARRAGRLGAQARWNY
jgi:general stress protein YciG